MKPNEYPDFLTDSDDENRAGQFTPHEPPQQPPVSQDEPEEKSMLELLLPPPTATLGADNNRV